MKVFDFFVSWRCVDLDFRVGTLVLLVAAGGAQRSPKPAPQQPGDGDPSRSKRKPTTSRSPPRSSSRSRSADGNASQFQFADGWVDPDGPRIDVDPDADPKMEGWQPQFTLIEIESAIRSLRDLKAGAKEVHYESLSRLLARTALRRFGLSWWLGTWTYHVGGLWVEVWMRAGRIPTCSSARRAGGDAGRGCSSRRCSWRLFAWSLIRAIMGNLARRWSCRAVSPGIGTLVNVSIAVL